MANSEQRDNGQAKESNAPLAEREDLHFVKESSLRGSGLDRAPRPHAVIPRHMYNEADAKEIAEARPADFRPSHGGAGQHAQKSQVDGQHHGLLGDRRPRVDEPEK